MVNTRAGTSAGDCRAMHRDTLGATCNRSLKLSTSPEDSRRRLNHHCPKQPPVLSVACHTLDGVRARAGLMLMQKGNRTMRQITTWIVGTPDTGLVQVRWADLGTVSGTYIGEEPRHSAGTKFTNRVEVGGSDGCGRPSIRLAAIHTRGFATILRLLDLLSVGKEGVPSVGPRGITALYWNKKSVGQTPGYIVWSPIFYLSFVAFLSLCSGIASCTCPHRFCSPSRLSHRSCLLIGRALCVPPAPLSLPYKPAPFVQWTRLPWSARPQSISIASSVLIQTHTFEIAGPYANDNRTAGLSASRWDRHVAQEEPSGPALVRWWWLENKSEVGNAEWSITGGHATVKRRQWGVSGGNKEQDPFSIKVTNFPNFKRSNEVTKMGTTRPIPHL
ncbi:hypothetical protein B0H14DRAFT_2655153 [Mycena olivaceomarginata]|nr:hypothetical protein B0H14DRAFT_2655153 [Mycena olivaceomarginata]